MFQREASLRSKTRWPWCLALTLFRKWQVIFPTSTLALFVGSQSSSKMADDIQREDNYVVFVHLISGRFHIILSILVSLFDSLSRPYFKSSEKSWDVRRLMCLQWEFSHWRVNAGTEIRCPKHINCIQIRRMPRSSPHALFWHCSSPSRDKCWRWGSRSGHWDRFSTSVTSFRLLQGHLCCTASPCTCNKLS